MFGKSNVPNFNKSAAFLILGTNLVLTGGKYIIKIIFHSFFSQNRDWHISNIECAKFQLILSTFNFATNLGWAGDKYAIKIIFDIKIETGMSEYHMSQISINSEHF